ncbi:hypothetical protein GCM10010519_77170 [Streptomyces lactacystinicus]
MSPFGGLASAAGITAPATAVAARTAAARAGHLRVRAVVMERPPLDRPTALPPGGGPSQSQPSGGPVVNGRG